MFIVSRNTKNELNAGWKENNSFKLRYCEIIEILAVDQVLYQGETPAVMCMF